jgi:hypothetical protein
LARGRAGPAAAGCRSLYAALAVTLESALPLVTIVALLSFSLRGHGRALFRSKWETLPGLPSALADRWQIQEERQVSPRDVRRLMSRGLGAYAVAVTRARTLLRKR